MLPPEFQLRIGIYIILGLSMAGSFVLGLYGIKHEIFRDPAIGEMLRWTGVYYVVATALMLIFAGAIRRRLRRFHPVVWHQLRGEPRGLRNFAYRLFHSENYFGNFHLDKAMVIWDDPPVIREKLQWPEFSTIQFSRMMI